MNKLLDNYLCEKYPKIFAERNLTPRQSCMSEGITCGDGWFSLLNNLCYNIQHHIDNPPHVLNPLTNTYQKPNKPTCEQFVAKQIKEKFSGLRFYFEGGDEYTSALVEQAESLSYDICEDCGTMDNTVGRNTNGWVRTTCIKHTRTPDTFKFNSDEKLQDIFEQIQFTKPLTDTQIA